VWYAHLLSFGMPVRDVPTQRGLNFQYHIRGSGVRTHRSIVRNNRLNEGVANVAGHAKSDTGS